MSEDVAVVGNIDKQSPASHREQLEDRWRTRVLDAQARYQLAATEFRKAVEEQRQAPLPSLDGVVKLARVAESEARAEFMRVLQIFNALVVDKKIPDEP